MVAQYKKANASKGITGVLFYNNKKFFQYLEGPKEEVIAIMDLIRVDPRHTVLTEACEPAINRLFRKWDMKLIGHSNISRTRPENELIE